MLLRNGRRDGNRRRLVATSLLAGIISLTAAWAMTPTKTAAASPIQDVQATPPAPLGDLAEDLALTDEQLESVHEVLDAYRGQAGEPGTSWRAAADLQEVLTSDQVETIRTRMDERGFGQRGRRADLRGRRSGYREPRGARQPRMARTPRFEGRGWPRAAGPLGPDLDLTADQKTEIDAIRESFRPRLDELREAVRDGSLSREDALEQRSAIQDEIHAAIAEVLTEDQRAALEEWKAEREERLGEMREQREKMRADMETRRMEMQAEVEARREAEHAAMVDALDLSDEQVTAIDALRASGREAGQPVDRAEADARREAHHTALLEILDDQQAEIWVLHEALRGHFARRAMGSRRGIGNRGAAPPS